MENKSQLDYRDIGAENSKNFEKKELCCNCRRIRSRATNPILTMNHTPTPTIPIETQVSVLLIHVFTIEPFSRLLQS